MEERVCTANKVLRKKDLSVKRTSCVFNLNDTVEEIVNCEAQITILDEQERKDKLKVFKTYMSLLKPLFNERTKIIESIPRFWATVIEYHPKLTYYINDEAMEVLRYVKKVEVDNTDTTYFKISFVMEENPYIENKVIIKEMPNRCNAKELSSSSTPIKWKTNLNHGKSKQRSGGDRKRKRENTNFFSWLCEENSSDQNLIVNCFDEIWQNPLPFFLLGLMDNEVEVLEEVEHCCDVNLEPDNKEDEDSSGTMDSDDCWSQYDEDKSDEEEDEDFESEEDEDEEINEDMDEDDGEI